MQHAYTVFASPGAALWCSRNRGQRLVYLPPSSVALPAYTAVQTPIACPDCCSMLCLPILFAALLAAHAPQGLPLWAEEQCSWPCPSVIHYLHKGCQVHDSPLCCRICLPWSQSPQWVTIKWWLHPIKMALWHHVCLSPSLISHHNEGCQVLVALLALMQGTSGCYKPPSEPICPRNNHLNHTSSAENLFYTQCLTLLWNIFHDQLYL